MGRPADAAAAAGLVGAVAALLAVSFMFMFEPFLGSLQPDPCGPSTFRPGNQPDTACLSAHPDYYQYDSVSRLWSTPLSRLSQTLDPGLGLTAVALAVGAALISWLALKRGTARRRMARSALTLGSLIAVGIVVLYLNHLLHYGD